jgi:hypothetical protein
MRKKNDERSEGVAKVNTQNACSTHPKVPRSRSVTSHTHFSHIC